MNQILSTTIGSPIIAEYTKRLSEEELKSLLEQTDLDKCKKSTLTITPYMINEKFKLNVKSYQDSIDLLLQLIEAMEKPIEDNS